MKVYVVGNAGPEHNTIHSIHKTQMGALKAWNKLRLELLTEAKSALKGNKEDREMYQRIIKNLSYKDPKKMSNYPHETPYIREYIVEE